MVELSVLTGRRAGTKGMLLRFPSSVGRAQDSDFKLEDAGVWDRHFEVQLGSDGRFELAVAPQAITSVNGAPVTACALRNGDTIQAGVVTMRFSLSPTIPGRQGRRELAVWVGLAVLTIGQLFLIRALLF